MSDDIEVIDGLPVNEAIRLGRVKAARYTVKGVATVRVETIQLEEA